MKTVIKLLISTTESETHGNQHVTSPLTVNSGEVLQNLHFNGLVNGEKDLNKLATLHGTQKLQSPLYFKEVYANSVLTNYSVSGININEWAKNTLWLIERPQQIITGNWSTRKLIVENGPQLPIYLIDGSTNTQYDEYMRVARNLKKYQQLTEQNERQIKYIEKAFEYKLVNITSDVKTVELVENYLVINVHNYSLLYAINTKSSSVKLLAHLDVDSLGKTIISAKSNKKAELLIQNMKNLSLHAYEIENENIIHKRRTFDLKAKSLLQSTLNPTTVYIINSDGLYELAITQQNFTKLATLPEDYQFLTTNDILGLTLCNSTHILLFNNISSAENSAVMPNEFQHSVESLLRELIKKLHLEVNITQLTIPETDLVDENLVPDFRAVIEQLENQQTLYELHTFNDINRTLLNLPETTAQILAARTVQIIWPCIKQVKELHDNARDKTVPNTAEALSAHIVKILGAAVHDVLLSAFNKRDSLSNDDTLMLVIQNVRDLQSRLETVCEQLTFILWPELYKQHAVFFNNIPQFCTKALSDILQVRVGSADNFELLAVANTNDDNVQLFENTKVGNLFQQFNVHEPHSLATIRIGNSTLLAFVENCCTVRIFLSNNAQHFVDFVAFETHERISKLFSYAEEDQYYFVIVLSRTIVFYVIVI